MEKKAHVFSKIGCWLLAMLIAPFPIHIPNS